HRRKGRRWPTSHGLGGSPAKLRRPRAAHKGTRREFSGDGDRNSPKTAARLLQCNSSDQEHRNTHPGGRHAIVEQKGRAAVRAHQGKRPRERKIGESREGNRGPYREQRTP